MGLLIINTIFLVACGGGGGSSNVVVPEEKPDVVFNVAFVTSVSGIADLGSWPDAGGQSGLAAGDAICQARAVAAGLTGSFRAWLSDQSDDVYCRLHNLTGKKANNCGLATLPVEGGPWIRTDGFPFSDSIDQLTTNLKIYSPLRYDEFGTEVVEGIFFTATNNGGILYTSGTYTTCLDLTGSGTDNIRAGSTESTGLFWSSNYGVQCGNAYRLACFETGAGSALPAFTSTGKKVFVTSAKTDGNIGGLSGGDAFCQNVADTAGITGTFKAWLSDSSTNAIDRLTSNGPWVRLDGVKIADDKTDLIDGRLFTPIDVNEMGNYSAVHPVWTGTDSSGNKLLTTCSDWQSNLDTEQGTWASAPLANNNWTNQRTEQCNLSNSLYCFED